MSVVDGSLLLAAPVAFAAGAVSFCSPCVLPLVPGYLSYVTGMTGRSLAPSGRSVPTPPPGRPALVSAGAPLVAAAAPAGAAGGARGAGAATTPGGARIGGRLGDPAGVAPSPGPVPAARRRTVLAGAVLFVLGFSAVFVSTGAVFGYLGDDLHTHQRVLEQVLGALTILLGLAFSGLLDRVPLVNRELRLHRRPAAGLAGAPLLGVLFGVGWTPCIGPTLGAVLTLQASGDGATAVRGAVLTVIYCLGLGLPFLLTAAALDRAARLFAVIRRHYRLVMLIGGALLVAVGVLEVTGSWGALMIWLKDRYTFTVPL